MIEDFNEALEAIAKMAPVLQEVVGRASSWLSDIAAGLGRLTYLISEYDQIDRLAHTVLTGRQLSLMHRGKARVRNKWRNEARRRLEKSGL